MSQHQAHPAEHVPEAVVYWGLGV